MKHDEPTESPSAAPVDSDRPERADVLFEFEVGRMHRDDYVFQLSALALRLHITLDVAENRGWLSSHYVVRASGKRKRLQTFCDSLNAWNRELRERFG